MNNPMISIIVPVYNVEEYIEECINSVVNQTFTDYEMILVDDGSTDNCPALCDTFADKNDRIRVVHKMNGGLSSARNAGINVAKGDYLLFLDSDDFLVGDDALEIIANVLSHSGIELLICIAEEYDEKLETVMIHHRAGIWIEKKKYSTHEVLDSLYRINGIWVTAAPTKIINREYCISHRLLFFTGIYHEDDEWIARVLLSDPQLAFLYHPWYGYRHRENSIVSSSDSQKVYKRICDKIKVADSMLTNKSAKCYKEFMRYASDYLFNTIISAGQLSDDKQTEFIAYLKKYRWCYKTIRYSKDMKLILKAIYITLFGEKRFINHYKG